jgi:predicted DNA-binding transcriptional regulator YafY
LERITFWVAASSKDYMTTKPIHDSMRKIKGKETEQLARKYPNLPAGGEFFSIDCKENYELIRELTSFGANLIVLSPQHIVQKVVKVAKEMVDLYGVTSVSDEEDSE